MKHYKLARFFAKPLVNSLWHIKVIDRHKFYEGKAIYICNHLSIMDVNAMCCRLFKGKINFVVKEDSIKGTLGKFLLGMGGIPIKRNESDVRAVKACLQVLKENKPLIIFPEGTRNVGNPKILLPFKDGPAAFAIKMHVPVIPLLYYRKPDIRHRNYLIVGDAVDLSEYYGKPLHETKQIATNKLEVAMADLRQKLDNIVEFKGGLRKYNRVSRGQLKLKNSVGVTPEATRS